MSTSERTPSSSSGSTRRPLPRGRRSRAPKGEGPKLRTEILDACERLLLSSGSVEAVSIRAVADAVGVTPPSIYRHFPDKDTLIFEVCARHFAVLDQQMEEAVAGLDDPMLRLQARGRAYVLFGRANPEPYRVMFMLRPEKSPERAANEDWVSTSKTYQDLLADIQACIDEGAFRPEFDEAHVVALGFWARVHGLTSLMVAKPAMAWSNDAFIDKYLETCLYGVALR